MTSGQLLALMETLTGHLHTSTGEEEQALNNVQEQIASSLLQQNEAFTNQQFSFAGSDLFFRQNIPGGRLAKLDEIVTQALENQQATDFRVFVRDVPVRTTQVTGSIPAWAAGARVTQTVGPFLNKDGRQVRIDIYRIEKLLALYIQGQTNPVILFKSGFSPTLVEVKTNPHYELVKNYNVLAGSVWINAHALSATAPADRYVGVRVKGGTITLDMSPSLQGEKITVEATNNIKVSLQLEQKIDADASVDSPYGKDARNAQFHLPETWDFTLIGLGKNITAVGNASCTMYGQPVQFTWANSQDVLYNAPLSRVLIPWNNDITSFKASACESPFCTISGEAPIQQSWWALPAAIIADITAPLEADSNGAVLIQCNKGLRVVWQGMKDQDMILLDSFFLGEPGRLGITELAGNALGASQHLELWKDPVNPHSTSVDLLFLQSAAFLFNTVSKGDELLMTLCNATMNIDRPVKVNGEPFEVSSKNSLLILGANATYRLIYLYDDNIIWDNTIPGLNVPQQKLSSIALQNALFTVSPVNGCLLFGACDEQWKKVTTANLFLTFGMYSYLPTLPDPYLANLNVLLRQFPGGGRRTDVADTINRTMSLWLICNVQYKALDETNDEVKVGFHFGDMLTTQSTTPGATTQPVQPNANTNVNPNISAGISNDLSRLFSVQPQTTAVTSTNISIAAGAHISTRSTATPLAAIATIQIPDHQKPGMIILIHWELIILPCLM